MDQEVATVLAATIPSIVTAISTFVQSRKKTAPDEENAEKPNEQTLQDGEQALVLVQEAVAEHGNEDERADLANFERNPRRYKDDIIRVIQDIAKRDQAFADQILKLQPQVGNDANQGSVTLNDNSKAEGVIGGVIQGTTINYKK